MSKPNDTSKSIKEMSKSFKNDSKDLYILELEKENKELKTHVETLLESIKFHQEHKLTEKMSDEETIALMQLAKLLEKSFAGKELSLEDLKKYDILVKNKRLAQGASTINAEYKVLPDDMSEDSLLQIAEAPPAKSVK